jgi:hypothetical protein
LGNCETLGERLYAAEQKTACLAEDQWIQEKQKTKLSEIPSQTNSCTQVEVVVN